MTHRSLIQRLPKAELHLHIEGSFEPELMMQLAAHVLDGTESATNVAKRSQKITAAA